MAAERGVVLILTQEGDLTADVVEQKLRADGIPFCRFDTADFPLRARLSGYLSNSGVFATLVVDEDREIDLRSLRSVWLRRPTEFTYPAEMTADTYRFVQAETRHAFSGLMLVPEILWMNDPRREALARLKPKQLAVAVQEGFRIPDTLITNDEHRARDFIRPDEDEFIYKRMHGHLLYTDDGKLTAFETAKLTADHLDALAHVRVAPCQFQRYVEKRYELRVTAVGRRVFAARADSQESPLGRTDWRLDPDLKWTAYRLPQDVERRILRVMERLGIIFGAFDLIREPSGEYVFLEVNPAGQWAWFDEDVTYPIRDEIVRVLAAGTID